MLYLNNFKNTLTDSTNLLTKLSDESTSVKKTDDKWSRKEILGHLIDSANVNYNRFISAVSKDDLVFGTYPQNEWVDLQGYNNRDWTELIILWKNLNEHIAELVKRIPKEKRNALTNSHNFDKICWKEVKKDEESSLDYLIKDYIGHLEHHLKQIYDY